MSARSSPSPASGRQRLPDRRDSVVLEYDLDGVRYRAQLTCGANGDPLEIFLDGPKVGSAACIAARDAAVAASLALQFGCDASALSHALLKLSNGQSAGPVGKAFEMLAAQ